MTLVFNQQSEPKSLSAKCWGPQMGLLIHTDVDSIELSYSQFCDLIYIAIFDKNKYAVVVGPPSLTLHFDDDGCRIEKEGTSFARFSLTDFEALVQYFITNSNIMVNDPRTALVNKIIVAGDTPRRYAQNLCQWFVELTVVDGFAVDGFSADRKRYTDKNGNCMFGW